MLIIVRYQLSRRLFIIQYMYQHVFSSAGNQLVYTGTSRRTAVDKEKWEVQRRWGITAFLVIVGSAVVILTLHNFKFVTDRFNNLISILSPIITGAVMAYLVNPAYNLIYKYTGILLEKIMTHASNLSEEKAHVVREKLNRKIKSITEKISDNKYTGKTLGKVTDSLTKKQIEDTPLEVKRQKLIARISSITATVFSVLFVLIAVFGLVSMIIPELYKSLSNLYITLRTLDPDEFLKTFEVSSDSNSIGVQVYNKILSFTNDIGITAYLSEELQKSSSSIQNYINNSLLPNLKNIMTSLGIGLLSAVTWIKNFIIGLIIMVYLLNTKSSMLISSRKILFAILPEKFAQSVMDEVKAIDKMFGGFIVGKIVDSFIIGIICFVVLSFMDMPYTMLVSVIVGVTNIIPFFGPFIGAIPSIILILLQEPIKALYFAIFILILQQLDGNIIGPYILRGSTGLSSFWVLFSILLFGGLFGFVGMIIGVPIWAIILQGVKRLTQYLLDKKKVTLDDQGKLVPDNITNAEK